MDEFLSLTPEELAALPPGDRVAYEQLAAMDPEERARFGGHIRLTAAAWEFLRMAVEQGNLYGAWPLVHPDFRLCLAQQWLLDNREAAEADGFDLQDAAEALAQPQPVHELWEHFERVHVRSMRQALPPAATWGVGANTRLVAPDLELLNVHDTSTLADGESWAPGEEQVLMPLLMRWDGGSWLVANIGSDSAPRPGWPPLR